MAGLKKIQVVILTMLALSLVGGCKTRLAAQTPFTPPPVEYLREMRLVFENASYYPLAQVPLTIEFLAGEPLGSIPLKTGADGGLSLTAKPLMILGAASEKNGDLFISYKTSLKITLWPGQAQEAVFNLDDIQNYAYYQDPLYHGQNRGPYAGPEIINFTLPRGY